MATDTFLDSSRVRVDLAGRAVIPSSLRSRLHITFGDELILAAVRRPPVPTSNLVWSAPATLESKWF